MDVAQAQQAGNPDPHWFGQGNVYHCGSLALRELEKQLGGTKMTALLRAWEDRYAGKNASRADFEAFLTARYGKDLSAPLKKWLDQVDPEAY